VDIEKKKKTTNFFLWGDIFQGRQRAINNKWCLLGDFNLIRKDKEGKKRTKVQKFNIFIENMVLG